MVVIRRKADGLFHTNRWTRSVLDDNGHRWTNDLSYARLFLRVSDAKQSGLLYDHWGHTGMSFPHQDSRYEIIPVSLSVAS